MSFQLRESVINQLHDCHPGIARMKALTRSYFWWPSVDEMVETDVKQCRTCQVNQSMPASPPIHYLEQATKPWA